MSEATALKRIELLKTVLAVGCCLAYFSIAYYTTTLGAAAAAMMARWQMDGVQQGLILTVQSVGGILLAILFLFFGNRVPKVRTLQIGLIGMCVCFALMALMPKMDITYGVLLLLSVPAGLAVTSIDVLVNGVAIDVYGERSATVLPFAHATYSVGATLAPFIASLLIHPEMPVSYGRSFGVGFAVCCIALLCVAVASADLRRSGVDTNVRTVQDGGVSGGAILRNSRAWLYLICGLFYFCFLWGVTAWLPSFCASIVGFDYRLSNLTTSGFFLGALAMRFLSPLLFRKLSPKRVFLLFSALSAICMLVAVLSTLPSVILPFVIASGFCQGTLVICIVMMCCAAFPADTAGASAIAVLAGTLGMLIAPIVMGVFSGRFSFRISMCFAVACLIVSCVLALVTKERKTE